MSFFQSTEFYVILFLVAAAIVALLAKPKDTAEAREYLLAATLSASTSTISSNPAATGPNIATTPTDSEPSIAVYCDESGGVWLRRTGIEGLDDSGAVSAKVLVKGFNITVYERITEGKYGLAPADTAIFSLDFLTSSRYWLRYESETTNRTATLSFRNTPGYRAQAPLKQ